MAPVGVSRTENTAISARHGLTVYPTISVTLPPSTWRRNRQCLHNHDKATLSKPDRLALIDAKTGPRHVLLGGAARTLLASVADSPFGEWVFQGESGDETVDRCGSLLVLNQGARHGRDHGGREAP